MVIRAVRDAAFVLGKADTDPLGSANWTNRAFVAFDGFGVGVKAIIPGRKSVVTEREKANSRYEYFSGDFLSRSSGLDAQRQFGGGATRQQPTVRTRSSKRRATGIQVPV
jgi:hypothetical protein